MNRLGTTPFRRARSLHRKMDGSRSTSVHMERLESRRLLTSVPFETTFFEEPLLSGRRIVTTGDVDGDQVVDFIMVEATTNSVQWYRNETTPGAELPIVSTNANSVGSTTKDDRILQVTSTDVNEDGRLDVVVGTENRVGWFRQLQNGRFSAMEPIYDPESDSSFEHLFVADFNRDGQMDLVVAGLQSIHVLLKDADGQLQPSQVIRNFEASRSLIIEDFDGDLDPDLVVANHSGSQNGLYVYRNDTGMLTRVVPFPSINQPERILSLDADGDGDQDLLTESNYRWTWIRNDGNWIFVDFDDINANLPTSFQEWTAGDVNGDGRDEIIIVDGFNLIAVAIENDAISIQQRLPYRGQIQRAWRDDLNADGETDFVLYDDTALAVRWVSGYSMLSPPVTILGGRSLSTEDSVVAVDLDRDGDPDLLTRELFGELQWFESLSDQTFALPKPFEAPAIGTVFGAADIDGDGDQDLLGIGRAGGFRGELIWLANDNERSFSISQTVISDFLTMSQFQVIDLDANGTLDIVLSYYSRSGLAKIVVVPALSAGVFGAPVDWIQFRDATHPFELVDWDEDGRLDLMTIESGTIRWSRQSGRLVFELSRVVLDEWVANSFQLGDMDHDGDLDLARDYPKLMSDPPVELANHLAVFRNEGQGRLLRVNLIPQTDLRGFWADMDGDEREDLVLPNDQIQWYASLGAVGLEDHLQTIVSPRDSISTIVPLDVDHDLDLDLIVTTDGGLIYLQRNQTIAITRPGDLNRDGQLTVADIDTFASWRRARRSLAQADLNVDGRLDDADRDRLIHELVDTVYGDANDDQQFDSSDLVALFVDSHYDQPLPATWKSGDFNGDGVFDSLDLILAMQNGAYRE